MRRYIVLALVLAFTSIIMAGCGETINGMSKDIRRISKGVKTVFVRND